MLKAFYHKEITFTSCISTYTNKKNFDPAKYFYSVIKFIRVIIYVSVF